MKIDPHQSPLPGSLEPRNEETILTLAREKIQVAKRESGTETALNFKRAATELKRRWSDAFKLLRRSDF